MSMNLANLIFLDRKRPDSNPIGYGYFKLMDSDGDFIIRELTGPVTDLTLKFHQDTGKDHRLISGKPIASGTTQYCTRFA
jgi:hypothetical protein